MAPIDYCSQTAFYQRCSVYDVHCAENLLIDGEHFGQLGAGLAQFVLVTVDLPLQFPPHSTQLALLYTTL